MSQLFQQLIASCLEVYFAKPSAQQLLTLTFAKRPSASENGSSARREKFFSQCLRAKLENPFDIRPDEQAMHQKIQRHRVANMVARARTAVTRLERVLVNPFAGKVRESVRPRTGAAAARR
jgi:hypothetical protein